MAGYTTANALFASPPQASKSTRLAISFFNFCNTDRKGTYPTKRRPLCAQQLSYESSYTQAQQGIVRVLQAINILP